MNAEDVNDGMRFFDPSIPVHFAYKLTHGDIYISFPVMHMEVAPVAFDFEMAGDKISFVKHRKDEDKVRHALIMSTSEIDWDKA